jgi:hypothetical protein
MGGRDRGFGWGLDCTCGTLGGLFPGIFCLFLKLSGPVRFVRRGNGGN